MPGLIHASKPVGPAEAEALLAPLRARFGDAARFLLAVSGGPDSTALMAIAAFARQARLDLDFRVVSIDHGLRPEAPRECALVSDQAVRLGLPAETLKVRHKIAGSGIQAGAREARYALLVDAARRHAAAAILTAHTLDDQVETVVMRLFRGSDLAGLAGIPRSGLHAGVPVVRPLLDLPKARLLATVAAAGLAHAEDPSNADHAFERVRIRALLPVLAEAGFTAARILRLARRAGEAADAIAAGADTLLGDAKDAPGETRLDAHRFAAAPAAIRAAALRDLVARHADPAVPERRERGDALADALGDALGTGTPFTRTLRGALIRVRRGEVIVASAPPRREFPSRFTAKHPADAPPSLGNRERET